jgi:choline transport protein
MAELTSAWPTSSGSYHWASQIIPQHKWYRPVVVWTIGWTNLISWWMMMAAATILAAQCIMECVIILTNFSFEPARYQTWLVYVCLLLIAGLWNSFCIKLMPWYTRINLWWSIGAFFVFIIVLCATNDPSDRATAHFTFAGFINEVGWTDGMAWLMGYVQTAGVCLTGYDSIVHMVEELPNPTVAAPFAIIYTPIIGGVTGFLFLVALLFQIKNVDNVSSAYIALGQIATNSAGKAGGIVLTLLIAIGLGVASTLDTLTCSRMTYALARDRGFIFPEFFDNVNSRLKVPVRAIWISIVFVSAVGAIYVGSSYAFNSILGCNLIFLTWSYVAPVLLLLIFGRENLGPRPFNLGRWGYPVNTAAVLYGLFASTLSFFPYVMPVQSHTMNYVVVVVGSIYILLAIYWLTWARRTFVVPQMDIFIHDGEEVADSSISGVGSKSADSLNGKTMP